MTTRVLTLLGLTAILGVSTAETASAQASNPVEFHVAASAFVARDKTPKEFAEANPEAKIVEVSIRVSANFNIDEAEVERIEYRLKMPEGFTIVDYLPTTELGSEVAGPIKVANSSGRQSVKVVAVEGGANVRFQVPPVEVGVNVQGKNESRDSNEVGSSVQMELLPPKRLIRSANTQDEGRTLLFKLQQRDQITLQGDKDFAFLAEVPKTWTGGAFTLESTAFRKGDAAPRLAAKNRAVGLYLLGDRSARAASAAKVQELNAKLALEPSPAPAAQQPSTPAPTPAPAKKNVLPIDGTWRIVLTNLFGFEVLNKVVELKDGAYQPEGAVSRWTNFKLLSDGRYSATRFDKAGFGELENSVYFVVEPTGTLLQDDAHLGSLHRMQATIRLTPVKLADEALFKKTHPPK